MKPYNNKKNISLLLAAALAVSSAMTGSANASAAWAKTEKGYCYTDDATGKKVTGWKKIGAYKYYFNKKGIASSGWKTIKKNTYHFAADGKMDIGWKTIKGNTYYFGSHGKMCKGTVKINGTTYSFDKHGALKTNKETKLTASDVLASLKKSLGKSYPCDNAQTEERISGFLGLDTTKIESWIYEDDSMSSTRMDCAIILKVKDGYAAAALKALQKSFDQTANYSHMYNMDSFRVGEARLFSQDNYVALLILGKEPDSEDSEENQAKFAAKEAKKIDKAWKEIFGKSPKNLIVIPEYKPQNDFSFSEEADGMTDTESIQP